MNFEGFGPFLSTVAPWSKPRLPSGPFFFGNSTRFLNEFFNHHLDVFLFERIIPFFCFGCPEFGQTLFGRGCHFFWNWVKFFIVDADRSVRLTYFHIACFALCFWCHCTLFVFKLFHMDCLGFFSFLKKKTSQIWNLIAWASRAVKTDFNQSPVGNLR